MIKSWSARLNIISKSDLDIVVEKHILPSIMLHQFISWHKDMEILDLGSGAGFPGIVLKIMYPDISLTLIDSVRKKYLFLTEVCDMLSLNCTVLCKRVEEFGACFNEKFDIIVCRSVARLDKLWDWSRDLLVKKGHLYAIKGGDYIKERENITDKSVKIVLQRPDPEWIAFAPSLKTKFVMILEKSNG
jgi:16S rRNA (guanine527-N7)-methyltransferase